MRSVSTTTTVAPGTAIALSIPHEIDDAGIAPEAEDWLILRITPVEGPQ